LTIRSRYENIRFMPQQTPVGANFDPKNSSKRDLIVLVTGFGDFRGVVDNPASAVASRVDGELRSVTNDWGNTIHMRIVGVGNVPVNFQDDSYEHQGPSNKDNDIENYVKAIHDNAQDQINKIPGPQFVAAQIEMTHPDVVISLGVDSSETRIRVEREAHNVIRMDAQGNTGNYQHPVTATRHDFVEVQNGKKVKVEAYLHDGDAFETLQTRLPVERIVDAIGRKGIACHSGSDPGKYVCENVMWEVLHEIDHPRNGTHILRGGFIHLPLATQLRPVGRMVDCIIEACMETAKVIPESEW
jgi:pyrrolidone-carboxylate peptidase